MSVLGKIETSDDILTVVLKLIVDGSSSNAIATVLAEEIKSVRKEVRELRLLLEHEEAVRSQKLHKVVPVKQSFLRGTQWKAGDRIRRNYNDALWGHTGTIERVDSQKKRVHVRLDSGGMVWMKHDHIERVRITA